MTQSSQQPDGAGQEVRLAVVLTGGVSLAIWMGGVAREINLMTAASRARRGEEVPEVGPTAAAVRGAYGELLDLLDLDVTIDVLSGTSAGGINAALLGLANVRRRDLGSLRDLWLEQGSLAGLLRDPRLAKPSSLLQGDAVLLAGLRDGIRGIAGDADVTVAAEDPTAVFVTTTLLDGQASRFRDDYDTTVNDVDHHGLFTFNAHDLGRAATVDALALAARCSASFPAAFEAAFVPIGAAGDEAHPDMSPYTTLSSSQYAADGGLLANRPIAPALAVVFDRPADGDVRRVLAYVVPSPGAPSAAAVASFDSPPGLGRTLLADLGAVTSQSVTSELQGIRRHNEQVRVRRELRRHLARLAGERPLLDDALYRSYRDRVADAMARVDIEELLRQLAVFGADLPPGGEAVLGFGRAHIELQELVAAAYAERLPDAPPVDDPEAFARLGRPAFDAVKAILLWLLRTASRAASPEQRRSLAAHIRAVHATALIRRERPVDLTALVRKEISAGGSVPEIAVRIAARPWIEHSKPEILVEAWRGLADATARAWPALAELASVEPTVADLCAYVGSSNASALARVLQLHIAERVLSPETPYLEQSVELVQFSADTRTELDEHRALATDKLTGLQVHHFGAFYKRSWRANDWMWGRIDGAGWLVHLLLDPRRVRARAAAAGGADWVDRDALPALTHVAGSTPSDTVLVELRAAAAGTAKAASLPATARWVAKGIQQLISSEELACVAAQVELDRREGASVARAQRFVDAYWRAVGGRRGDGVAPPVPLTAVPELFRACEVSKETFKQERGTALLTRTIAQGLAVGVAAAEAAAAVPAPLRPVAAVAHNATQATHQAVRHGGSRSLVLALALLVAGVGLSTSTIAALSGFGVISFLAGVILLAVVALRPVTLALATVGSAAALLLAAAGVVPAVRRPLFDWLRNAVDYLSHHSAVWAIVVLFLLLPPLTTFAGLVGSVTRRRRRPAAPSPARGAAHRVAGRPRVDVPAPGLPADDRPMPSGHER